MGSAGTPFLTALIALNALCWPGIRLAALAPPLQPPVSSRAVTQELYARTYSCLARANCNMAIWRPNTSIWGRACLRGIGHGPMGKHSLINATGTQQASRGRAGGWPHTSEFTCRQSWLRISPHLRRPVQLNWHFLKAQIMLELAASALALLLLLNAACAADMGGAQPGAEAHKWPEIADRQVGHRCRRRGEQGGQCRRPHAGVGDCRVGWGAANFLKPPRLPCCMQARPGITSHRRLLAHSGDFTPSNPGALRGPWQLIAAPAAAGAARLVCGALPVL